MTADLLLARMASVTVFTRYHRGFGGVSIELAGGEAFIALGLSSSDAGHHGGLGKIWLRSSARRPLPPTTQPAEMNVRTVAWQTGSGKALTCASSYGGPCRAKHWLGLCHRVGQVGELCANNPIYPYSPSSLPTYLPNCSRHYWGQLACAAHLSSSF
jgi:hypothetical protein